jgi:hypothetical protein
MKEIGESSIPLTVQAFQEEEKKEENTLLLELSRLDINAISPLEALNLLSQWKKEAKQVLGGNRPFQPEKTKRVSRSEEGPGLFDLELS